MLHSNMYVVEENGHAIVIDPCKNTDAAKGLTIDLLIVTHEHYDHISGVNVWKKLTGAPLLCSGPCATGISSPKKNMSRYFDVFCEMQTWIPLEGKNCPAVEYACEADRTFEDTLTMEWQGHCVSLIEIPGHSPGSIGISIDGTDFFSGDSLFENSEIELHFPGGSAKQWEEIGKARIESIPEGTRIWPGHFEGFVLHRQP